MEPAKLACRVNSNRISLGHTTKRGTLRSWRDEGVISPDNRIEAIAALSSALIRTFTWLLWGNGIAASGV